MKRIEYYYGQHIGGIKFICELPPRLTTGGNVKRIALFECPLCERKFQADLKHVKRGAYVSCGCRRSIPENNPKYKHGLKGSPNYSRWKTMNGRCHTKTNKRYKDWGGRGVSVCNEWRYNFKAYNDYIMALHNALMPGYSIDRIDNDGNYEPGNVRWATARTQNKNKRNK